MNTNIDVRDLFAEYNSRYRPLFLHALSVGERGMPMPDHQSAYQARQGNLPIRADSILNCSEDVDNELLEQAVFIIGWQQGRIAHLAKKLDVE